MMDLDEPSPTLAELVATYQNTAECNDALHGQMTAATWADPLLAAHRSHIEDQELGFGDAAFHALWLRLLTAAAARFGTVRALEIGVFKGQVISLWSALAKARRLDLHISAISPLKGQPLPTGKWKSWLRYRLDREFREKVDNGNFYADTDYEAIIAALFRRFDVEFNAVTLYRGYSTDEWVLERVAAKTFEIVYVDGDHTYEGALHDFRTFGPKVKPGGWLVADDAGIGLPGTTFWKGHASVSRAAEILPTLGFRNVLNVGHNRVFERIDG
jgi:hypothetical protein